MTALAVRPSAPKSAISSWEHSMRLSTLPSASPLYKNYYHGLPVLQRSSPKFALNSVSGKPRLGLQDLAYTMMHMENP